jgi:hypothetical protein
MTQLLIPSIPIGETAWAVINPAGAAFSFSPDREGAERVAAWNVQTRDWRKLGYRVEPVVIRLAEALL